MSDLLNRLWIFAADRTFAKDYPSVAVTLSEAAAEIARLQAVVDAAWTQRKYHDPECLCVVCLALADLDGSMYRSTAHQPSDSGTDNVTPPADLLRGSDADGE